jgi:hypothetical protein
MSTKISSYESYKKDIADFEQRIKKFEKPVSKLLFDIKNNLNILQETNIEYKTLCVKPDKSE